MVDTVITGHRPQKLPHPMSTYEQALKEAFDRHNIDRVIQGMADGIDLVSAKVSYQTGRPFMSVRPGIWHTPGKGWEKHYEQATKFATRLEVSGLEERYPGPWIFQRRNEYMVDKIWHLHGDIVIAVWDGSASGTKNCVMYALEKNIRVWRIDPNTFEGEWTK